MAWIQGRLDGTSCVGQLRARRPLRRRLRDRRLAPTALKMPPLPGLRTAYLALIAVKRAGVAAISNVQQRTITEEQWLLSPGRGDILNAVGANPRLPSRSRPGGE